MIIRKIISGGQTGADRGGLEAARALSIPIGGVCPKGFKTEKGSDLSLKEFGLKELNSSVYEERTMRNIEDSDGTVIFCKTDDKGNISGIGTLFTVYYSANINKPFIVNPGETEFISWLKQNKILVLNVAGNRESLEPGICESTKIFLIQALSKYSNKNRIKFNDVYLFTRQINRIKKDNYSGSAVILSLLISAIKDFAKNSENLSGEEIKNEIIGKCNELIAKHNNLIVLHNFTREFISFLKSISARKGIKKGITSRLAIYEKKWSGGNKKIVNNAMKKIDFRNKIVLLHSNSSTVIKLFEELKKKRIKVNVIQTESRPVFEGRLQAKAIAALGFKVRIITDAAISKYMEEADIAIVGADSVHSKFFINKIGTYSIALACREFKKPLYVITDSRKIGNTSKSNFSCEHKKPDSEIWNEKCDNITVENYYFESVPLKFVKELTTEL
ncbi:hypothetical protein D4R99_02845 [bacterium]|nr:MAG: hypothetical protein D4R99_02845 [bacterium]